MKLINKVVLRIYLWNRSAIFSDTFKRISMKKVIYPFISLLILMLQGCSTINIAKDYSFDTKSPSGLLLGSITYDGYYAKYSIYLKNLETEETHIISAGGSMTPFHLFNSKGTLDHLGIKGDLFAVELQPGDYEVYKWSVAPGNGTHLSSRKPYRIKLKIINGDALYFGSVNFKQTATFGVTISGTEAFYLSQYDRDIKEFKESYHNVKLSEINRILKDEEVFDLGSHLRPHSSIFFSIMN